MAPVWRAPLILARMDVELRRAVGVSRDAAPFGNLLRRS